MSRAQASRLNGARSRGPKTAAGKARSARNALKHGLRSCKLVLLDDEDATEFQAFVAALQAELAPAGCLQGALVRRIAMAAWRGQRADQLEAALLARYLAVANDPDPRAALGAGLIRDGNGPRALETLVRYRGSVLAELLRALAALKALQAEDAPAAARLPAARLALPVPTRPSDRDQGDQAAPGP